MRAAFIAIAMSILSSQATMAQQNSHSGAALLNACKLLDTKSNENLYQQGICLGILSATFYHLADSEFCPPNQVSRAQNVRIVTQYVERNPRDQHLDLGNLAIRAYVEAWPCLTQPQRR